MNPSQAKYIKCPKCNNTFAIYVDATQQAMKLCCPFCHNFFDLVRKNRPIQLGAIARVIENYQEQQTTTVASSPTNPQRPKARTVADFGKSVALQQPVTASTKSHISEQILNKFKPKRQEGDTILGKDLQKGIPTLVFAGRNYPLEEGQNTVGRHAESSSAKIQLPVDDRYMSRLNAVINVQKQLAGQLKVTIESCNERNLVRLNNQPVPIGNTVNLFPGMIIGLGHTEVTFTFIK